MKQTELIEVIFLLKVAYPYYFKNMSKVDLTALQKIYYQFFNKYHIVVFKNAIADVIKHEKFMPSIAEIYEKCRKKESEFFKKILLYSKEDIPNKKYLDDMIDWYGWQENGLSDELKTEIMSYYPKLISRNVLLLDMGGENDSN